MKLKVKKLRPDAQLPAYQSKGAACFDLVGLTSDNIPAGGARTLQTGLAFEIPKGHVMLVYSRSGHGYKNGARLANCVGVIDSDYRGEVTVRMHNDKDQVLVVHAGTRIAQAMILPLPAVQIIEVDELGDTERGTGGYGSTGA